MGAKVGGPKVIATTDHDLRSGSSSSFRNRSRKRSRLHSLLLISSLMLGSALFQSPPVGATADANLSAQWRHWIAPDSEAEITPPGGITGSSQYRGEDTDILVRGNHRVNIDYYSLT